MHGPLCRMVTQAGDPSMPVPTTTNEGRQRKRLRVRPAVPRSDPQADKWRITHKLGIQTRDLRLLDPGLSTTYPSAILCRDKAIVVNLEYLKVIITTSFVLIVNPGAWLRGGCAPPASCSQPEAVAVPRPLCVQKTRRCLGSSTRSRGASLRRGRGCPRADRTR
jgi:hypothetical protein